MRAIIIEDEKNGREILLKLLEMHCPEVIVCSTANSVTGGIKLIRTYLPDLVFLDIKLGNENSFEILDELKSDDLDFSIIFTTAYEEFAIKAIKNDAADYLMKPIDADELKTAVEKVSLTYQKKLKESQKNIGSLNTSLPQKIKIHNRSGFDLVDIDQILYCRSEVNYTHFHFKDKKSVMTSKTLRFYQQILEKYWFLRIHRSSLINIKEVKRFIHGKKGQVVLSNGEVLEVGNNYKKELLARLEI